jgi:hypothetical protein
MKLSEIKNHLATMENVNFELPNGTNVPAHFHVTEVGLVTKHFIDCGGTTRHETFANLQLWNANDTEHRLKAGKLLKIIDLSKNILGTHDHEIEVEYQTNTIGRYGLHFDGENFILVNRTTACLAMDSCGIPASVKQVVAAAEACCTPGGGCC